VIGGGRGSGLWPACGPDNLSPMAIEAGGRDERDTTWSRSDGVARLFEIGSFGIGAIATPSLHVGHAYFGRMSGITEREILALSVGTTLYFGAEGSPHRDRRSRSSTRESEVESIEKPEPGAPISTIAIRSCELGPGHRHAHPSQGLGRPGHRGLLYQPCLHEIRWLIAQ
jgi:hypothetical protein